VLCAFSSFSSRLIENARLVITFACHSGTLRQKTEFLQDSVDKHANFYGLLMDLPRFAPYRFGCCLKGIETNAGLPDHRIIASCTRGPAMKRLPVTIISGYLGAGKTSLINRLLAEDHGMKVAVIVNDFGAINIDADLISDTDADTIALSNGCVCCTMGTDLAMTLRQLALRENQPCHLIIEASGVSDPIAITNTVMAESGFSYAGIITLVDGKNAEALFDDEDIAPQITQQIRAADLTLISKCESLAPSLLEKLQEIGARTPTVLNGAPVSDLLLDIVPLPKGKSTAMHPAYATWQHRSKAPLDRRTLGEKLANRPNGLYRMKGHVLTSGGAYQLHIVGRHVEARHCDAEETLLVGLGLADRVTPEQIDAWWHS
jgi:hypothetical protein